MGCLAGSFGLINIPIIEAKNYVPTCIGKDSLQLVAEKLKVHRF